MAYLVGEKGKVVELNISKNWLLSKQNINKSHSQLLKSKNVEIFCGDGRLGYLEQAPYDAIHVGAASQISVVNELCKQLKNGGKMVIPVELENGEQIFREYVKDKDGKVSFKNKVAVRYVPLTSEKSQRKSRLFG